MEDIRAVLETAGLSGAAAPESEQRFSDGLRYRVEIPSCEGPGVFRAVLEEAEARGVPLRRVSQGSGVMMLGDHEIREMARMGADNGIEVSLFLGPRAAWDVGAQAKVTSGSGGIVRGDDAVLWCAAEARRAAELGIRSLLVADIGVLCALAALRDEQKLPSNMLFKVSVLLPVANPAAAHAIERAGAGTINVATDLSPQQLGEIRAATSVPLDVYVEVPDDQGGAVRYYEVPEMIRRAAPMYVKLGIRNAPNIYPTGAHIEEVARKLGRERVRRTELVLRLIEEMAPELFEKRGDDRPADLAIPEP